MKIILYISHLNNIYFELFELFLLFKFYLRFIICRIPDTNAYNVYTYVSVFLSDQILVTESLIRIDSFCKHVKKIVPILYFSYKSLNYILVCIINNYQ